MLSSRIFRLALLAVTPVLVCVSEPSPAQTALVETPGESAKLLEDVRNQIARGRAQLETNQSPAVDTLRDAAQQSLNSLVKYVGPNVLTAPPEEMPTTGFWAAATRQAAEAHYWWGRAADHFGRRDEAITALSRAARFAGRVRPGASDQLPRDSLLALSAALRDGLPLLAPDDALTTVAEIAHGKLWSPRRFEFAVSPGSFSPRDGAAKSRLFQHEFLVTSGRVYPPVPAGATDVNASLSRVPPIYRDVPADALPGVLRLDRMVVGYARESAGPNKGLWKQVVRVFYPSTYLTRASRDDRARAEALAAQFLKVHALFQDALGLTNPYTRDGVTTLWLSEVSALWPRDDSDPRVRQAIGTVMPRVNTPSGPAPENLEIAVEPNSFPWRTSAGQSDASHGDVLLFNLPQPRDEAEWLRELMHEYGHVALPALDGFQPPLEPYANGLLGETLGVLWAASTPQSWNLPADFGIADSDFTPAFDAHVAQEALPALRAWKAGGPLSALRRDKSTPGLQYLQGLAVYIERVYGANVLASSLYPMVEKSAAAPDASPRRANLNTDNLVGSFASILRNPFGNSLLAPGGVLPVWLPGALDGATVTTPDFIARANLKLKAGQRVSGWLFVPPSASHLHLEWRAASPNALRFDAAVSAAPARPNAGANNAANLVFKTRAVWQRITFTATADVEIIAAQFEKTPR